MKRFIAKKSINLFEYKDYCIPIFITFLIVTAPLVCMTKNAFGENPYSHQAQTSDSEKLGLEQFEIYYGFSINKDRSCAENKALINFDDMSVEDALNSFFRKQNAIIMFDYNAKVADIVCLSNDISINPPGVDFEFPKSQNSIPHPPPPPLPANGTNAPGEEIIDKLTGLSVRETEELMFGTNAEIATSLTSADFEFPKTQNSIPQPPPPPLSANGTNAPGEEIIDKLTGLSVRETEELMFGTNAEIATSLTSADFEFPKTQNSIPHPPPPPLPAERTNTPNEVIIDRLTGLSIRETEELMFGANEEH